MEERYIITQQDADKERFNAEANNHQIEIKDVSEFLRYTFFILELAFQVGIINQIRRDEVSFALLDCFESDTRSDDILVTNKMYIFSAWLMEFSKWDAWLKLEKIIDFKSACEIYKEAENWYFGIISQMQSWHELAGKNIKKIDNSSLKNEHSRMANLLIEMKCYAVNPKLSFKNEHISKSEAVFCYVFIDEKSGNVIEVLKQSFYQFAKEMQIFAKLDGRQFVEFSCSDYFDAEKAKTLAGLELNEKFEKKIKALKKEREELLDAAIRFNIMYDNMSEEEQAEIPGEVVEANDEMVINSKYALMISKIQDDWHAAEENLNKMFSKVNALEGCLILQDNPSLSSMLQENALVSLCKRGVLNYPDSRVKRGMLLDKITVSFAIYEFLNYVEHDSLTKNELEFLQSSLEKNNFEDELEEIRNFSEKIENLTFNELIRFSEIQGLL